MKFIPKKAIPNFIKRLDHYLLINYPLIWSSKLHYILFFGGIILIVNVFISFFITVSYSYVPDTDWILIYTAVISCLLLIVWIYSQSLINYRVYHGITKTFHDFLVAAVYLFTFFLLSLSIFIPYWNLNGRISDLLDKDAIPVGDYFAGGLTLNTINSDSVLSDTTSYSSLYWNDPWQARVGTYQSDTVDRQYGQMSNLDISLEGLPEARLLYEDWEQQLKNENLGFVRAVIPTQTGYDTVQINYNNYQVDSIRSDRFEREIFRRRTLLYNESKGRVSWGGDVYYYRDDLSQTSEYFHPSEIQRHLLEKSITESLEGEKYSSSSISSLTFSFVYRIYKSHANKWGDETLWQIIIIFSVLCCYLTIMISAAIKFFGIKSFVWSICTLVLSFIFCLWLVVLFAREVASSSEFMFYALLFLSAVAFISVMVLRDGKRIKYVLIQWVIYSMPFLLIASIQFAFFAPESGGTGNILLLVLPLYYFLVVPFLIRRLYHMYASPEG